MINQLMKRIFGSKISAVILTLIILAGVLFFQDFYRYAVYMPRINEYTADDFKIILQIMTVDKLEAVGRGTAIFIKYPDAKIIISDYCWDDMPDEFILSRDKSLLILRFKDYYETADEINRPDYAFDFRSDAFIYDTDEAVKIYKTRGGFGSKIEIDGITYKKLNYFEWKKYHNLIQEKQR